MNNKKSKNKLTVRRSPLNDFDLNLFSFYSKGNLPDFITPKKANIYRWVEDSTNGDYIANGKEGKKDGLVFSYDDSTFLDFLSSSSEEFKSEIEKIKRDSFLEAEGVQIFIGKESGYETFDNCSIVTASYSVDGQLVGSLGVIGPTRMPYDRVISAVDVTAKLLSAALNQG